MIERNLNSEQIDNVISSARGVSIGAMCWTTQPISKLAGARDRGMQRDARHRAAVLSLVAAVRRSCWEQYS
jgi:hypothetical protein